MQSLRLTSSGLLLTCIVLAVPANGLALQSRFGDAGWRARTADGRHCVTDRLETHEVCWPAAPGSLLTDLAPLGDGWIATGSEAGSRLFLVRGDATSSERLASPPDASRPQGRPQLVTDGVRLLGLVWLEGERQEILEVRAAEWLGTTWRVPMTVSPAGAGSQVALTASLLDDGRWLVVWTAFDGRDDETVWSAWDGMEWSPPARVHEDNTVPDITPTVVATSEGAFAAWAWFDGSDYRLRLAAFDGKVWHQRPVASGLGVASPRLSTSQGASLLTFSSVIPDSWVALELAADGSVIARATVARHDQEPPWVDSVDYGAEFTWHDGDRSIVSWERPQ